MVFEWVLCGLVFLIILALLCSPFFYKQRFLLDEEGDTFHLLLETKELYLQQIADLEYDYRMEKVNREDYESTLIELKNKLADLYEKEENYYIRGREKVKGWLEAYKIPSYAHEKEDER